MNLIEQFNNIIRALNKHKVDYILIGGYAVILHGLPRTTQDMDIILKMNQNNISNFRTALKSLYDDPDIEEIQLNELKDYAVIRFGTPDNFYIDIMARIGEVADYDTIAFEEKKVNDIKICIATPEALYMLKKDTIRPQDKSDAVFLKEIIEKKNS